MAIRGHGGAKNLVPKRLLCPCNVLNADADTLADAFVTVVPHDGKICTTSIDGSQIQLSGLFYLWHCLCLVHFS